MIRFIVVIASLMLLYSLPSYGGKDSELNSDSSVKSINEITPTVLRSKCIKARRGCYTPKRYRFEAEANASIYRDSSDFRNQWGLAAINADMAYAHLYLSTGSNTRGPGYGVTVGFVDTGIDRTHSLFNPWNTTEYFFSGARDENPSSGSSHGTETASVVIAQPDSLPYIGFHGVAYGARVKMFAIPIGTADPDRPYSPIRLELYPTLDLEEAIFYRRILSQRIDVLNLSFGWAGIIENYSESYLRRNIPLTIAQLAQSNKRDKTILVFAAGNSHGDRCSLGTDNCVNDKIDASSVGVFSGLPVRIPELRGHSVAVVGINREGYITDFSNACGIAAEWCIAAPSEDVVTAYYGPSPNSYPDAYADGVIYSGDNEGINFKSEGTSYAAPFVTGGLAVMKQMFRSQLPNTELLTRLFKTADKSGPYQDSAIYGQGLMDLGAATFPVGVATVPRRNSITGPGSGILETNLKLGSALGDGLQLSLEGQEIAAFDSLGAPFWYQLGDLTVSAVKTFSLSSELRELLADEPTVAGTGSQGSILAADRMGREIEQPFDRGRWQFGLLGESTNVKDGFFRLAEDAVTLSYNGRKGVTASAFTTSEFAPMNPVSGLMLSWNPKNVPILLKTGLISEQNTVLGSEAAGAFGSLSANSFFFNVGTGFNTGKWQITADAEIGTVNPKFQEGMITDVSALAASAFSILGKRKLASGPTIEFEISQPLRLEKGRATLSVPIGRTHEGELLRSALNPSLTPSGRQIDISARWRNTLANGSRLVFDTTWMLDPGHIANSEPELRLLAGWRHDF